MCKDLALSFKPPNRSRTVQTVHYLYCTASFSNRNTIPGRRRPLTHGHFDVHEYYGEVSAPRIALPVFCCLYEVEGLAAVIGDMYYEAVHFELFAEDLSSSLARKSPSDFGLRFVPLHLECYLPPQESW